MMRLNSENLVRLKQQFAKYRDELDVHEFCHVMQQHLAHEDPTTHEQIALIANLSELFAQVDVNGDEVRAPCAPGAPVDPRSNSRPDEVWRERARASSGGARCRPRPQRADCVLRNRRPDP
eukprot:6272890-Prymnesium_polylepis.2